MLEYSVLIILLVSLVNAELTGEIRKLSLNVIIVCIKLVLLQSFLH